MAYASDNLHSIGDALRCLHRMQERGASGAAQDAMLRLYGITPPQQERQEICFTCKKPVIMSELNTPLLKKEYSLSKMCAKCQNSFFAPSETVAPDADGKKISTEKQLELQQSKTRLELEIELATQRAGYEHAVHAAESAQAHMWNICAQTGIAPPSAALPAAAVEKN